MQELAPDVWQLHGTPQHAINVFLIGDVLIDAATRWSTRRILRQIRGRSISRLVLTHCHPDHQGAAAALCGGLSLPLECHALDVPAMEGQEPMQPDSWLLWCSRQLYAGPPYRVSRQLKHGDEIAGFQVLHAPGHTPGEIILFRESDRVAIAGDVVNSMSLITLRPGLHEPPACFTADVAQNRRSIQMLADLEPSLLCVGHGPPWRDPQRLKEFASRLR